MKTQKLKLLQNSKTKIATILKQINCKANQNLELGPNSTQSLTNSKNWKCTKFNNSNGANLKKTQILIKKNYFWQKSFVKNDFTPWQPMRCIQGSHLQSCDVFFFFMAMVILSALVRRFSVSRVQDFLVLGLVFPRDVNFIFVSIDSIFYIFVSMW